MCVCVGGGGGGGVATNLEAGVGGLPPTLKQENLKIFQSQWKVRELCQMVRKNTWKTREESGNFLIFVLDVAYWSNICDCQVAKDVPKLFTLLHSERPNLNINPIAPRKPKTL